MTDIRCSFKAFVDYDVYFDENIDDKQTGDHAYIMTVHKLCSFRQRQIYREKENERDRHTEKAREREREKKPRRVSWVLE